MSLLRYVCSKNALLEGLEIDQYMWGIINELAKTDVDEVNIEANASWKPVTVAKEEDSKGEFITVLEVVNICVSDSISYCLSKTCRRPPALISKFCETADLLGSMSRKIVTWLCIIALPQPYWQPYLYCEQILISHLATYLIRPLCSLMETNTIIFSNQKHYS